MRPAWFNVLLCAAALAAGGCGKKAEPPPVPPSGAGEPHGLVKEPNVAGGFYPADAAELSASVKGYLAAAATATPAEGVVVLFAPHAGYPYSGAVAALAYKQLEGRKPATVVLLGPSHHSAAEEIATGTYDGYRTPLGTAAVDTAFVTDVQRKCADVRYDNAPFAEEHGLEVQLPFVQTLFPDARVAPFIFCEHDATSADRFGRALASAVAARRDDVLIVVTCDLSHYHPYAEAVKLDGAFVAAFKGFDAAAIFAGEEAGTFEIDAPGPVAAAFVAARELGATRALPLEYKNSGDVTGDKSAGVVGYFAGVLTR